MHTIRRRAACVLPLLLALAAAPAAAQTLMCKPGDGAAAAGVPDGGTLVIVLSDMPLSMHGCVGDECQPVSGALIPGDITAESFTLTDEVMGLVLRVRRDRLPVEMQVELQSADGPRRFGALCEPN